jgi:hypothetical protein
LPAKSPKLSTSKSTIESISRPNEELINQWKREILLRFHFIEGEALGSPAFFQYIESLLIDLQKLHPHHVEITQQDSARFYLIRVPSTSGKTRRNTKRAKATLQINTHQGESSLADSFTNTKR